MSGPEPKKAPARKARVFHDARERIVETDKKLDRTSRDLSREQYERKRAAHERDLFKSVIHDPQKKQYLESLYRQIGSELADMAFQEIVQKMGDGVQRIVVERLHELAYAAGDGVAAYICKEMEHRGIIETFAYDRPDLGGEKVIVQSCVDIPAVQLRFNKVHSWMD